MNELAHQQGPDDGLRELALFAGAGGGILGGKLLGWQTVCAVEWGEYPAGVLCARQNEGLLPPFPIWDNVETFDGKPWRGIVDVVSGGFPCQDISVAGKGAGITGERSGMWSHMARIIGEVRPRFAFVENSPALLTRGLGVVLGDLAALGYDCRWGVLGAADVGANHQRDRVWIVAHTNSLRQLQPQGSEQEQRGWVGNGSEVDDPEHQGLEGHRPHARQPEISEFGDAGWWATEPDVGRVAHGLAARVDRLKAIGNGQVPLCAATAFRILTDFTL
jgi:DNA (cytosine-5)-methyltransferase 1